VPAGGRQDAQLVREAAGTLTEHAFDVKQDGAATTARVPGRYGTSTHGRSVAGVDKPERDMDEPLNIKLSPEEALKVLVQATEDTDVDGTPPVGGWIDEESD
jgi:hypothetical protein